MTLLYEKARSAVQDILTSLDDSVLTCAVDGYHPKVEESISMLSKATMMLLKNVEHMDHEIQRLEQENDALKREITQLKQSGMEKVRVVLN